MLVEIVNYSPLKTIELFKKNNNKSYTSFEHSSKYELIKNEHSTLLKYSTIGSFNFPAIKVDIIVNIIINHLIIFSYFAKYCNLFNLPNLSFTFNSGKFFSNH